MFFDIIDTKILLERFEFNFDFSSEMKGRIKEAKITVYNLPLSKIFDRLRKITNPDVFIFDSDYKIIAEYVKNQYGSDLEKIQETPQTKLFKLVDKNINLLISYDEEDLIQDVEKYAEVSLKNLLPYFKDYKTNPTSMWQLMQIYTAYKKHGIKADKMPLTEIYKKVRIKLKKRDELKLKILKILEEGER